MLTDQEIMNNALKEMLILGGHDGAEIYPNVTADNSPNSAKNA